MVRKYLEVLVCSVIFLLGVYLLFPPTFQYVYGLKRASYHQDVVSQFMDIEQLEIIFYDNSSTQPIALINEVYLGGILAIDGQGKSKFLIENFPDYEVSFNTIYYDSKDQLWILPDSYYNPPYAYNVPWIYILNISTGDIIKKIPTNRSYRGSALCMHNNTAYIAFDNSGLKVSFGFIENYILNTSVKLDFFTGMVQGHICMDDSMIVLLQNSVIRYFYNSTENVTFILKENENNMHSITWDEKNKVYYTEDKKSNDLTVSDIIVFDLLTNKSDVIETGVGIHDIMYDDGIIYITGDDFNLYIHNISTNTYYRKLEYVGEYPSIHKLDDNFIVIGNYLLNKEENMLFPINISECCWDTTMIG